jgi:Protein of unknown function (DUF4079)
MLVYAHPVGAALTIAFLGYVGSLALRARSDRREARQLLARHARLAPILYGMVLAVWASGLVSTWMLRRDLAVMESGHFRVGGALVIVLSGSVLSSHWMTKSSIRAVHPWLGAGAMLMAAAQVFFGLQILP